MIHSAGRAAEDSVMKPRERRETGEMDLFRSRLDQIISSRPVLAALFGMMRRG